MDVAVVDYTAPDAPERFSTSLRATGFAVLTNHPLSWLLVEQVYAEWSELFDDPDIVTYTTTDSQTGYFPPDISETAKGFEVRDLKEFFHVYPWSAYPHQVSDTALRPGARSPVQRVNRGWRPRAAACTTSPPRWRRRRRPLGSRSVLCTCSSSTRAPRW